MSERSSVSPAAYSGDLPPALDANAASPTAERPAASGPPSGAVPLLAVTRDENLFDQVEHMSNKWPKKNVKRDSYDWAVPQNDATWEPPWDE